MKLTRKTTSWHILKLLWGSSDTLDTFRNHCKNMAIAKLVLLTKLQPWVNREEIVMSKNLNLWNCGIALCTVTIHKTRNSDKQTEINISKFLIFVWLLSLKCKVCLSFVIKMRKMTKRRRKLQISQWKKPSCQKSAC